MAGWWDGSLQRRSSWFSAGMAAVLDCGSRFHLTRRGRGGGWDGFARSGKGFHQLDAGAIGIEEIDLTLAVNAGVGVKQFGVGLIGWAGLEDSDGLGYIGHCERGVFLTTALVGRWQIAVEHELDVVLAVRNAHVDPAEDRSFGTAAPELAEAEEITVKGNGFCTVSHEKTEMVDGLGDAGGGKKLAGGFGFHAVGLGLDELDQIAVGVFDLEVEITGAAFADLCSDRNTA